MVHSAHGGTASRAERQLTHTRVRPAQVRPEPAPGVGDTAGGEPGGQKDVERPLFEAFTDQDLVDLGVVPALLPLIRRIVDEDELLGLAEVAPQLTSDVLLALHDGKSVEEVLEHVTVPVKADSPVDPEDFAAAVARPATQVTSDDAALQAVLGESFARWQVFLHPTQRQLVDRVYGGPARVSGGPGTGKTIVALHRAGHLAARLPPGDDKPILLTTFNRNLAADLRARFLDLVGPDLVDRVDIVNIDKLASRVVGEAGASRRRRTIDDDAAVREWAAMLDEVGERRWDAEFLAAEWAEVVLGQVLRSRTDYFKARRPGRGRPLSRADRDAVWQLVERFTKRLDDAGVWTWRQVAEYAARTEQDRAAAVVSAAGQPTASGSLPRYRYRHVVVDEAQDLNPAHWKMLRAMVAPGRDDIFLVGDTHQRIYDNYVTLGSLGVNIRGRSAKLTLSYRTTRQILWTALRLLAGETYDDLDGGDDNLAGYRSLLSGGEPVLGEAVTWADELKLISGQIRVWESAGDGSTSAGDGSTAVCVPTRRMVEDVVTHLEASGISAIEIGPDGPKRAGGVHVGTMHRFKGLEYRRIIIGGASAGLVPRGVVERYQDVDPKRYQQERARDRSLLFVAATRARDDLAIFWHGRPSPFLAAAWTRRRAVGSSLRN
ncbi:hypothetical protein ThrDRAFT_00012 [Frankia casuarinae]|uniref:DNA 3'-5' helicase n=1 Tax=Frankia casuarinae (strain DSM 45818 / CECT 9043 / HFP020203 / CcI3) TaxID=106370 RepID=Q2JGT8_FRACC|nr:UvrD-helicase domain-containing protein [Frankia casuarinae]ABD09504.1 putative DNA helicase [Frankia casuarinae]EYT94089.1 hypothetical protein ThrDRAFT_00012 [Frankia casuarinae]